MKLSTIIVVFGLMLELVEFNETYKVVKSYKYPHARRPPRWHPLPKSRKRYRPKRIPIPPKYHPYEPDHHGRYAPSYEDTADAYDDYKPYVIVIQVSPRKEKKKPHSYRRQKVADLPRDIDYIDEDDDELKVYQPDNKGVRIKVHD